jgi:hypothetical protein
MDNPQINLDEGIIGSRIEQIRYVLNTGLSGKYLNNKHKGINFLGRAEGRVDSLEESIKYVEPLTLKNRDFADIRDLSYDAAKDEKWRTIRERSIIGFIPESEKIEYEPDKKRTLQARKNILCFMNKPEEKIEYAPNEKVIKDMRKNIIGYSEEKGQGFFGRLAGKIKKVYEILSPALALDLYRIRCL